MFRKGDATLISAQSLVELLRLSRNLRREEEEEVEFGERLTNEEVGQKAVAVLP